MSSHRMRLRTRIHRLTELSTSLGKVPNAKEYEVKSLVTDFDKVSRKQLARLKKGKQEKLSTRAQIIGTYGLKSRERIIIDEEMKSMMKLFDSDQKRLFGILQTYIERKTDISTSEQDDRQQVINYLKECKRILNAEMEEQTLRFEHGFRDQPMPQSANKYRDNSSKNQAADATVDPSITQSNYDDSRYLAGGDGPNIQDGTFDGAMLECQKMLDKIERQFLMSDVDADEAFLWNLGENMTHSYYKDTLNQLRPAYHMFCDLAMWIIILFCVMGTLTVLRSKNIIGNYHQPWVVSEV